MIRAMSQANQTGKEVTFMPYAKTRLQTQMFLWYSIIVLVVVAIVSFVSVHYIASFLVEKEEQNTSNLSRIINGRLDTLYTEMAKVSSVVVYNRQINYLLDDIYEALADQELDEDGQLQYTRNLRSLIQTLVSINGPSPAMHSINIAYPEKDFFTGIFAQTNSTDHATTMLPRAVFEQLRQANGYYVILPPHNDFWILDKPISVISVIRENKDINGKSYGLVEVQQNAELFAEICTIQTGDTSTEIVVFDREMNQIYPFVGDKQQDYADLRRYMLEAPDQRGNDSLMMGDSFYGLSASKVTGFYVAVKTPYHVMMRTAHEMQKGFWLLAALLIIVTFFFIFLLSRTLATPIQQLCAAVDKVDLEAGRIIPIDISDSVMGSREVIQLNQTFENMLMRLQTSAAELAATRVNELESYFYTLHAQINPHFIHNVLTNIGAIADENEVDEISGICYMLSKILRYSLSDVRAYTEMQTEFENTQTYFKLLQFRYGQRLQYTISMDPDLNHVAIPKLILQPLVENTIIHGKTAGEEAWCITVKGEKTDSGHWQIVIEDSGSGFSEAALVSNGLLLEQLKRGEHFSSEEVHRQIGGMGIANVALRLNIFFGNRIDMSIANLPGRGAAIVISGRLEGTECIEL